MLVGEPGIGKTRTAEEFAEVARGKGATVLWGRCFEGEWAPPYGPFSQALAEYVHNAEPDALRNDLGRNASPIARLIPALREKLSDIEEPVSLQPDEERFRLLDAVSQFLISVSQRAPVVLVLDDLHWADAGTVAMLRHVARFAPQNHVLIVGAYRDAELDPQHPLADALAALRGEAEYERISLKGLDHAQVGELLTTITEHDVPTAFVWAISAETDGNPFFIREILVHLAEEGKMYDEHGRWTSNLSVAEMGIPEGVREVIGRRLSRLSDGCNRMLTPVSTMSGGFTWAVLRAVCDADEAVLLDALDEALRAQVLQERGDGAAVMYDFTHALIRHTLYEGMSAPRRVLLHREIGDALERLYAPKIEPHVAELAYHFYRAAPGGDVEKAIDCCARAAGRAMELLAFEEAVGHYGRSLELLEQVDTSDLDRRYDLFMALADAQFRAGDFPGAGDARRRAADVARKLGSGEHLARAVIAVSSPWALGIEGVPLEGHVSLLEEALSAMGEEDSPLHAQLLINLSIVLGRLGRNTSLGGEAVAMARRIGDGATLAYVLNGRSVELAAPADLDQRGAVAREARDYAERAGDTSLALYAECVLLQARLEMGDIAGTDAGIEAHGRMANETHQFSQMWHTIALRAMRATLDGRFDEAERLVGEMAAFGERMGHPLAHRGFMVQTSAIWRATGRMGDMVPRLLPFADDQADPNFGASSRVALALIYAETGREPEARALFERFASEDFVGLSPRNWLALLTQLSDVSACLRDAPRAARLYELLVPCAMHCVTFDRALVCDGSASRVLGLLAATMSRWDDADRHFQDALEMNERIRSRPWTARTQLNYAEMLLARGRRRDRDHTLDLLEPALTTARELGMAPLVQKAAELLGRAQRGGYLRGEPAPRYPDRLTAREVDILRLIAGGRTNSRIAADLVLSERTVARHITNLYRKIGTTNKAQATTYAIRHNLN